MNNRNRRTTRNLALAALCAFAVFSQGCLLDFSGDNFQRLKTFFRLTQALAQGEAALVHTWFFPAEVVVKKRWVQVSGLAAAPDGGSLPANATVIARFEDMDGKQLQKITLKLKIKADGTFSARKKIKKNVSADSMLMVTVMPASNDLEEGTELTLCVDIGENKADLKRIPVCATGGGGNSGPATLTELQNSFFSPTCDSFGCHNPDSASAGLVLSEGMSFMELVNESSSQLSQFDRVEPGDPENSYLVKKLRGDPEIDGERMPEGGPFLTDAQLARVISWINDGAPNN